MWSLAGSRQEVFLFILITLGITSFFFGMLTSVRKSGGFKNKK